MPYTKRSRRSSRSMEIIINGRDLNAIIRATQGGFAVFAKLLNPYPEWRSG